MKDETIRYKGHKYTVDAENKCLRQIADPKVTVDYDEIWEELSDREQNIIAAILSDIPPYTDEEIEEIEDMYEEKLMSGEYDENADEKQRFKNLIYFDEENNPFVTN